jgi:hypothetical protein
LLYLQSYTYILSTELVLASSLTLNAVSLYVTLYRQEGKKSMIISIEKGVTSKIWKTWFAL